MKGDQSCSLGLRTVSRLKTSLFYKRKNGLHWKLHNLIFDLLSPFPASGWVPFCLFVMDLQSHVLQNAKVKGNL